MNCDTSILKEACFLKRTHFFISEFIDILNKGSEDAAGDILNILSKYLPLKASIFFSFYEKTRHLTIKSQVGFSYSDFEDFQMPAASLEIEALLNNKIVKINNITEDHHLCINKHLINTYNLKRIVVIPVELDDAISFFSKNVKQKIQGMICIFPEDRTDLDKIECIFLSIKKIISKIYISSVRSDRFNLRKKIIEKAITKENLGSFLHETLMILKKICF